MALQKEKSLTRYGYIDALRGIAIIGVLLAHTAMLGNVTYPSWLYNLTTIYVGPRGVQLFFVVSAFTLYLSWSKRQNKEKHVVRNFYVRRFFRIAPLFYLAIVYYLFIQSYWVGNPNHFSLANIFTTFFFINGAFPMWMNNIVYGGWSIAVEMMFYLFFPFIVSKLYSIRTSLIATFVAMLLAQIVRLELNNIFPILVRNYSTYTFEFFPSQLPVFLIGITVFLLMKRSWTQGDKRTAKVIAFVFIILLILQFIFKIPFIAGHYLYGLSFGALVYSLAFRPIKLLVNAVTIHIGKVSYSMYLCHIAVVYFMEKYHLVNLTPSYPIVNFFLMFGLLLVFSTIVATILFYLIERPGQMLGKKIIDSYEKTPTHGLNTAMKTW